MKIAGNAFVFACVWVPGLFRSRWRAALSTACFSKSDFQVVVACWSWTAVFQDKVSIFFHFCVYFYFLVCQLWKYMCFGALCFWWTVAGSISAATLKAQTGGEIWSLWASNRTQLTTTGAPVWRRDFLYFRLLLKSVQDISFLELLRFTILILLHKLINMHISSSNSAHDFISLFNFDMYPLWPKLIDTLWLSQKHYFHILALRIAVYEAFNGHIRHIIFPPIINFCCTCFQLFLGFVLGHQGCEQSIFRSFEFAEHIRLLLLGANQFFLQSQNHILVLFQISLQLLPARVTLNEQVMILLYFLFPILNFKVILQNLLCLLSILLLQHVILQSQLHQLLHLKFIMLTVLVLILFNLLLVLSFQIIYFGSILVTLLAYLLCVLGIQLLNIVAVLLL